MEFTSLRNHLPKLHRHGRIQVQCNDNFHVRFDIDVKMIIEMSRHYDVVDAADVDAASISALSATMFSALCNHVSF